MKYYMNEIKWNDGLLSATILQIDETGHKRLIVTDDIQTIQTYRQQAERVTQAEIDALWG